MNILKSAILFLFFALCFQQNSIASERQEELTEAVIFLKLLEGEWIARGISYNSELSDPNRMNKAPVVESGWDVEITSMSPSFAQLTGAKDYLYIPYINLAIRPEKMVRCEPLRNGVQHWRLVYGSGLPVALQLTQISLPDIYVITFNPSDNSLCIEKSVDYSGSSFYWRWRLKRSAGRVERDHWYWNGPTEDSNGNPLSMADIFGPS